MFSCTFHQKYPNTYSYKHILKVLLTRLDYPNLALKIGVFIKKKFSFILHARKGRNFENRFTKRINTPPSQHRSEKIYTSNCKVVRLKY